jgi:hypothetical protein
MKTIYCTVLITPNSKASPTIESSVSKLGPEIYQMGTKFICEKVTGVVPESAVATWKDEDVFYCLRETTVKECLSAEKEAYEDLICQAGTSSAVWPIGANAVCKVKTWCEGMELESSTLHFLADQFPHIPVPKVIYSWLDKEWNRTFLILKRIEGQTLQAAWPSLTLEQRHQVAATVAQYYRDLATTTSLSLRTATGCRVLEPFLNVDAEDSHPSWKPRLLGPFPLPIFEKYLQRISTQPTPPIGDTFCFYHADLGPTNITVSSDGKVTGILDWESAGFYPKFWISLKPYMSAGFFFLNASSDTRFAWRDLLGSKLTKVGFELNMGHVEWYKSLNSAFFNVNELFDIK